MDSYAYLSAVYDIFMDNIPYREWSRFIIDTLKSNGISDGLLLELGCGTGTMTQILADNGYDLIGVDNSEEMLSVALDKKYETENDILYLHQDMREFELYGTVKAVICVCDSINYILNKKELVKVFQLVNNYLDPGGIFLFDFNTVKKYEQIDNLVIAENRDDCSFIWENTYDHEEKINQYDLTIFIKEESGKYHKVEETHYQRAYTLNEMIEAIEEAGLEYRNAYNAYSFANADDDSERICIIGKEKGKKEGITNE